MRSLGLPGVLLLAVSSLAISIPDFALVHDDEQNVGNFVGANDAIANSHPHTNGHGSIETNQTIYQYLSQQTRYTKLVKLIDFDEEYVTVLNATGADITFFAPDNKALTPPHKKNKHHESKLSLAILYKEYERLQANAQTDGDDDDDEEKKKRFKKILHALLKYHTLPTALDHQGLSVNVTYGTALEAHDGSYGGQPRRISVQTGLFGSSINFYVGIEWVNVNAENGYIYGVNKPLIPPPSILDELFFVDNFSYLTSALQKVGLENELQWRFKKSSETTGDGPIVSLFAPNDWAFKRLPPRLRIFLFSHAGEKVLKKILQYHIVPDFILHSDWVYNATSDDDLHLLKLKNSEHDDKDWFADSKVLGRPCNRGYEKTESKWASIVKAVSPIFNLVFKRGEESVSKRSLKSLLFAPESSWPRHGHHDHESPNITVNITVPTLLKDHNLSFVVGKPKERSHGLFFSDDAVAALASAWPRFFRSYTFVDGVFTQAEGVARNGAVYGLTRLLNPCKRNATLQWDDGEDNSWDGWEDYLPAWGNQ